MSYQPRPRGLKATKPLLKLAILLNAANAKGRSLFVGQLSTGPNNSPTSLQVIECSVDVLTM